MAEYIVQEESLISVADAIREKTGGTEGLAFPEGFIQAIRRIESSSDGSPYVITIPMDISASVSVTAADQ